MSEFIASEHPHTRYNPLNGQWVLVSPHRMKRPWSGQQEPPQIDDQPDFDPNNPLCPGVVRKNGERNPKYESTFVFTNDFPALLEDTPLPPESNDDPLFQTGGARGTCRVMCFHPKSNQTLPIMKPKEIETVINGWIAEFNRLAEKYTWVQIFENKGQTMGCSNPHPHCQIWASSFLPSEPGVKDQKQREYFQKYGRPLLADYVEKELAKKERIVIENPDWLVVVPYWAVWPYETMIISRNGNKRISDLTTQQIENLALVIKELTTKYDNLFKCSFPYSMGFHGAPTGSRNNDDNSHWILHASYFPPLLRSSSIRKFMVGFELLCQAQRDLTAEQAAEKLRNLNGLHFTEHFSYRKVHPHYDL